MIRLRDLGGAIAIALGVFATTATAPSLAAEKVKVAVFPSVSALPFYVARERGLFAAEGIEAEQVVFQSHPLIFQALITGDADTASNTVTLEGANINLKRPGTAYFFALNAQNATWRGEVVVVRDGFAAASIKDFKGKGVKILCAPGPANREAARAVFAANGLVEGTDFTMAELQMGDHVGALKAGTFDAGYVRAAHPGLEVARIELQHGEPVGQQERGEIDGERDPLRTQLAGLLHRGAASGRCRGCTSRRRKTARCICRCSGACRR